ncbi:MAG: flagellar motor protein MotB [Anaerolineae bacterium]
MARKPRVEEEGNPNEWIVTYADLVTLLLVFFVVLYSMANTDLKNFEKIALSLRLAFNGMSQTNTVIQSDESSSQTTPEESNAAPIFFNSLPPKNRDFVKISSELTALAQELGVQGDISINMTMEGIIISLSEKLTFEPGEASLRPEVSQVLDKVVELLGAVDNKIRIEGHTDNIPTNSPVYPSNWELSVLRAVSVVHYLEREGGMEPERLQAAGRAEFDPVVPNDTRENRAKNRRVDIIIIYPGESRQFTVDMPPS